MPFAIKDNQIQEVDDKDVDVELMTPNAFFGSHINLIPLQSAVQGPRLFYGARFMNQAMPLEKPEAPLVQNLIDGDTDGRSFDELFGRQAGAVFADDDGEVVGVDDDSIRYRNPLGEERRVDLYNSFPFNRKSVSGKSRVAIRNAGLIRRLNIEDYIAEPGDEVWSYDPTSRTSAWKPIRGFLKHTNDKVLFRVDFESGRHVVVTSDHSLLTLDARWNLTPIFPTDCIINSTRCPVVFDFPETEGTVQDYDEGILIGLYLAEGHLSKSQSGIINIAVQPPERVREVRDLVRRVRGVEPHNGSENCAFTDHELYAFLATYCGNGSGQKFIHDGLVNKSAQFLRGMVAGYFGGDGCLWADSNNAIQVAAVSTSQRLRDDLLFVLHRLGIFATTWDAPRSHLNENWNDGFGLRVISSHLSKLGIWFFYADRQVKFTTLLKKSYRASPFEHLPFSRESRKLVYSSFSGKVPHSVYKSATQGAVAKHRLRKCAGAVGGWAVSDILWDKIVSITPAQHEEWVYDFEVEDSQAFAVNDGLLVHNTRLHNTAGVKVGDKFTKGQLLARSNYTDDKGTLAMGVNARVGLLPFKGYSMDDAIVVSQAFANRLKSEHSYTQTQDFDNDVKPGLKHYISLFPDKFKKLQLENLDEKGVVKPGTVLQEGDPIILATKPKVISSTSAQLGKLSKMMRQARADAAQTWDHHEPGMVTDVAHTKNGVKLVIRSLASAQQGDKIVFRSGQKGVISKILPDEHMPRTMEGQPLEVLLNPLGIPSRANNSIIYELLLGKAAQKLGKPIKLPGFNDPKESWFDLVQDYLQQAGVKDVEELWDPTTNKRIENPVTVGNGYVLKLHHTSESKASARGQGGYSLDQQPLQGGGEGAQAKRFSGLEIHSMLSAGAYKTLREGSTLRGQKNDEYWRQLRMGYTPREPGAPFVWDKFQALLMGAGMFARNIGNGKLRLGPMTDEELDKRQAIEIKNGKLVNLATPDLAPFAGGLFDHAIVGNNRWGKIPLPEAMPNPAFEKAIMQLLGLTQKEMRAIISGEMELPPHLR